MHTVQCSFILFDKIRLVIFKEIINLWMLKLNTNILLYKQPVWACVFFFTSRLYVYNKVIVLSSVAIRLSFLIITTDHANPKVLCDSDACYTTQNNWVTYLQAKLPPPCIIFPRTLLTAHAIPAQHCISCETLPTPVCFCHTGTSHVSQKKWVTCLPVKLTFLCIQFPGTLPAAHSVPAPHWSCC